jgi:hypothetical protein
VSARSIWKRPPMRFGTIVGDEANGARGSQVSDECVARGNKAVINATKTDPTSNQSTLFHSGFVCDSILQWGFF